jgi:hypothetical protein
MTSTTKIYQRLWLTLTKIDHYTTIWIIYEKFVFYKREINLELNECVYQ